MQKLMSQLLFDLSSCLAIQLRVGPAVNPLPASLDLFPVFGTERSLSNVIAGLRWCWQLDGGLLAQICPVHSPLLARIHSTTLSHYFCQFASHCTHPICLLLGGTLLAVACWAHIHPESLHLLVTSHFRSLPCSICLDANTAISYWTGCTLPWELQSVSC